MISPFQKPPNKKHHGPGETTHSQAATNPRVNPCPPCPGRLRVRCLGARDLRPFQAQLEDGKMMSFQTPIVVGICNMIVPWRVDDLSYFQLMF